MDAAIRAVKKKSMEAHNLPHTRACGLIDGDHSRLKVAHPLCGHGTFLADRMRLGV